MALTAKQIGGLVTWQAEGGTEIEVLQVLLNRATELHATGWAVEEFYVVVRNARPTALMKLRFRGVGQPTGACESPIPNHTPDGG